MIRPQAAEVKIPHTINGTIIKKYENAYLLHTDIGDIKAYTDEQLSYHDEITCIVKTLSINTQSNDHGYDEALSFKANEIVGKVKITKILSITPHFSLSNYLEKTFSNNEQLKSYQSLFLLGYKDESMNETYTKLSDLSIVHLFALSGMHVSILYALLEKILQLFLHKETSRTSALVLLGIYIYSIPYNVSLHRAYLMLVLPLLIKDTLHKTDILSLLFLYHVLKNPYIFYSPSFLLSYLLYFIVLVTKHLPYKQILLSLSSIPILIRLNMRINLLSFFIIPLLTEFLTYFYTLTILSLCFSIVKVPLISLISLFHSILYFTSSMSIYIPFSYPPLSFYCLYYVCFFLILVRLEKQQSIKKEFLFLISLLLSFSFYSQHKIYAEIGMINVGQGDCAYIRLPMNQGTILIDTGGSREYDVASTSLVPYLRSIGIHSIDYVYISHYDYDHYGALSSLSSQMHVKKVIDGPDERQIGELNIKTLESKKTMDKNEGSNVLYITYKNTHYLFTGDIGKEREKELLEQYHHLDVTVLKVPHHGSSGSSSVELFELIQPDIAFIGVGKNNRYGHPTRIVLDRLNQRGIKILRTDEDGNFCIRYYGERYYIYR